MKFLADESCARPVIFALREVEDDVLAIAEVAKGAVDEVVMERALSEARVLITEDHDFGELVYARRRHPLPDRSRLRLPSVKLRALSESKRGPVAFILRLPGGQHRE